ncbi:MAG: manganese efflux pump MntP family protein [Clostridiales Family XIII bacterium]|nr:manganese efflux pump MntP family protein [Clostridiales Family XIII bacterium]
MSFLELFIIAVGLSMDACAVAIGVGLTEKTRNQKTAVAVGIYFGIAQAAMPAIGYFAGLQFSDKISKVDHWVVFFILGILGGKMIIDALRSRHSSDAVAKNEDALVNASFRKMFPLAIATSIDALAVGVSFSLLNVQIFTAITFIGVITFTLSFVGYEVGQKAGARFETKARIAGGLILIFIGSKLLLEHLGVSLM